MLCGGDVQTTYHKAVAQMKDLMSSEVRTHLMYYSSPPGKNSAFKLHLTTLDCDDPWKYFKKTPTWIKYRITQDVFKWFSTQWVNLCLFCLWKIKSEWKTKISSQTTAAHYFSKQVKIINKTLNIVGCLGKALPQTSELFLLNQAWGTFDCSIKPQYFLVPEKERQEKKLH